MLSYTGPEGSRWRVTNMNSCPAKLCSLCLKLLITDKIMGNDNRKPHIYTHPGACLPMWRPFLKRLHRWYHWNVLWRRKRWNNRTIQCVCVCVFIYLRWPAVFYHVMQQSTACQAYAGRTAINTQRKPLVSHRLTQERVRERGMGHPRPNLITLSVLRFCSCSLSLSFLLCLSTNNELQRKESYLRMYFGISIECKALYVCKKIGERERERESCSPVFNSD